MKLYVVKQKCTTANIVVYSDISLFYYQKFFCWLNFALLFLLSFWLYFHLSRFLGGAEVGKNLTGKADLKHKWSAKRGEEDNCIFEWHPYSE